MVDLKGFLLDADVKVNVIGWELMIGIMKASSFTRVQTSIFGLNFGEKASQIIKEIEKTVSKADFSSMDCGMINNVQDSDFLFVNFLANKIILNKQTYPMPWIFDDLRFDGNF